MQTLVAVAIASYLIRTEIIQKSQKFKILKSLKYPKEKTKFKKLKNSC